MSPVLSFPPNVRPCKSSDDRSIVFIYTVFLIGDYLGVAFYGLSVTALTPEAYRRLLRRWVTVENRPHRALMIENDFSCSCFSMFNSTMPPFPSFDDIIVHTKSQTNLTVCSPLFYYRLGPPHLYFSSELLS